MARIDDHRDQRAFLSRPGVQPLSPELTRNHVRPLAQPDGPLLRRAFDLAISRSHRPGGSISLWPLARTINRHGATAGFFQPIGPNAGVSRRPDFDHAEAGY